MKTLFSSPGFRYSDDAEKLAAKVHNALRDIVREYTNKGYNPREVDYIVSQESNVLCLDEILRIGVAMSKAATTCHVCGGTRAFEGICLDCSEKP